MFPCTACGLCCQNISSIKELSHFDLGNGICKYLNRMDNTCNIYETRPDICCIDKMFELKYKEHFTQENFYIENAKVCNSLQEQYNLDESFRVKIGE